MFCIILRLQTYYTVALSI